MTKYKAKPVDYEARQWDGTAAGADPIIAWIQAGGMLAYYDNTRWPDGIFIVINTLNGPLHASPQDYIVQGAGGEFSVYKPDVFADTFTAA